LNATPSLQSAMSSAARIEHFRNTVRNSTNIVFEYHRGSDALQAWPW
jgi:hypothetical protein